MAKAQDVTLATRACLPRSLGRHMCPAPTPIHRAHAPPPAGPTFRFEAAAAEPPLFPELLQPGRRAVLLAVDPDLGGAVAALSWRNPPARAASSGGGGGSSSSSSNGSSSGGSGAAAADTGAAQHACAAALLASPGLQVELHDMPVEVWRYGSGRDKRQPEAAGLIRILRQYTDGGSAAAGWGAEGGGSGGAGGGAICRFPASSLRRRRKQAEAAAAAGDAVAHAAVSVAAPSSNGSSSSGGGGGSAVQDVDDAPLVRTVIEYSMPNAFSGKYAWCARAGWTRVEAV